MSNSSVEVGASILTGKIGNAGTTTENVTANLYGLDLNIVENIKPFQLNIKANIA